MMMIRGNSNKTLKMAAKSLVCVLVVLALVYVLPTFQKYQLSQLLIYAIACLGIHLCWGRAGILPLGQAAFFGAGAYSFGLLLKGNASDIFTASLLFLFSVIAIALVAFLIAAMILRRQVGPSPQFAIITLALTILFGQIALSWSSVTGGFNGLLIPVISGVDPFSDAFFVVICGVTLVCYTIARWVGGTPLGRLWMAAADDELRVQLFGFATHLLKAICFAIGAGFAAIAGGLFALHQGLVTPQNSGFVFSAELLIWTALGGRKHPSGAIIGAILAGVLSLALRDKIIWWELIVASLFILVVLKFPGGIAGGFLTLISRYKGNSGNQEVQPIRPPADEVDKATLAREITVQKVTVDAGPVRIIDNLSLDIKPGVTQCIIGPNGAGKTSLFNAMTGMMPPRSGDIIAGTKSLNTVPAWHLQRFGVQRKFQTPRIFVSLTIRENLWIAMWSKHLQRRDYLSHAPLKWHLDIIDDAAQIFDFLRYPDMQAEELSAGERQQLELVMIHLCAPTILLLDEPCAGLSPRETAMVADFILTQQKQSGATCVIIEHDMALVSKLAARVIVLHRGKLLAEGTWQAIQKNAEVRAVYAGGIK